MKDNITLENFKDNSLYKLLVALYGDEAVNKAFNEASELIAEKDVKEKKSEKQCENQYILKDCDVTTSIPKHITDYPGSNSVSTTTYDWKECVNDKSLPLSDETLCELMTTMYTYNKFINDAYLYGSENIFTMLKQTIVKVLAEVFKSEKIATTLVNPNGEKTPDDIIRKVKKIYNK